MINYKLGTIEASEKLLKDLYIDLRIKVNEWSKVTMQTPQARMGYIGQHLVSVVTGFPGGKSGARGYDLIINEEKYGEIKTCYRVDQLGRCKICGEVISSLENKCSKCGSVEIQRKNDSKWLITIKNYEELKKITEPYRYYFVLFEFQEIDNIHNNNIVASIWEVNPKNKGFAYCLLDYYFNIRAKSKSAAPFDMWPYSIKFYLTKPKLIYRAFIMDDGKINTFIFPALSNSVLENLKPLTEYKSTKTLEKEVIVNCIRNFNKDIKVNNKNKMQLLEIFEKIRIDEQISNSDLCDVISSNIYIPLIEKHKDKFPTFIFEQYKELM